MTYIRQFAGVACQRIHTACVVWGWGGCGNGMWSDELHNCVVFESDFYVCVFEKAGDFSDMQ